MAALCSWFLDGGTVLSPETFGYIDVETGAIELDPVRLRKRRVAARAQTRLAAAQAVQSRTAEPTSGRGGATPTSPRCRVERGEWR
jgi:hypothetical protein